MITEYMSYVYIPILFHTDKLIWSPCNSINANRTLVMHVC